MRKGRPRIHWCKLTRNIRLRAGLTQAQLAAAIKASQSAISLWEDGFITPSRKYQRKLEAIA